MIAAQHVIFARLTLPEMLTKSLFNSVRLKHLKELRGNKEDDPRFFFDDMMPIDDKRSNTAIHSKIGEETHIYDSWQIRAKKYLQRCYHHSDKKGDKTTLMIHDMESSCNGDKMSKGILRKRFPS